MSWKSERHRAEYLKWPAGVRRQEKKLKRTLNPLYRDVQSLIAEIDRCTATKLPISLAWHILKEFPEVFEEITPLEAKRIAEENKQRKSLGMKPQKTYWVGHGNRDEGRVFFVTQEKNLRRYPQAKAVIRALHFWRQRVQPGNNNAQ